MSATNTDSLRPLLANDDEVHDDRTDYGTASPSQAERGTFKRNLGAFEAFGIVISIVIGSGAFTSPGSIDTNVPSPGMALVIWLVGGILVWSGGVTFSELSTAIPGEGPVSSLHNDGHAC